jgi:hypothetical protein
MSTRRRMTVDTRLGLQLALPLWAELHALKAHTLANRIEPDWQDRAACAGSSNPNAWFPAEDARRPQLVAPLLTCEGCPVRRSCLAAGLRAGEVGIWGGTTEGEREAARAMLNCGAPTDDVLDRLLALPATPAPVAERAS